MQTSHNPGFDRERPLSIAVIGASGDLAMRKIFPALFALYCQELLPKQFCIVGFARSKMDDDTFRNRITEHLTCRYVPGESCSEKMTQFLNQCCYVTGQYNEASAYVALNTVMAEQGNKGHEDRIYYMSIPPFLFLPVAYAMQESGIAMNCEADNWSRVVIEKPFGRDRASSDELTRNMAPVFSEEQTYRIDHYLGKDVVQNLMVLRFANLIFDPIWNRAHVENVQISWMEDLSLEGRAGYFDEYGIIRDVMQNHLLQILALVAMEQPVKLEAAYVRDEKVKVLRGMPPVTREEMVVGQYTSGIHKGENHPGYREEKGVAPKSTAPTYAAAVLKIRNRRWDGVPFLMRAGKGLSERKTEIKIRFREVPGNIFTDTVGHLAPNELTIRVQPDAGISFRIINKVPGLNIVLTESDLDLNYAAAFKSLMPDAYESLILDVIQGDKSLFIRADELEAAWDVFTPVLHAIDAGVAHMEQYPFGTSGPEKARALAAKYGVFSW